MESNKAYKRLMAEIKKAGSQKAFAERHGISEAYVSDMVKRRRGFGKKILTILGLQIDYVKLRN